GKLLSGAAAAGLEAADFQAELQRHMHALKSRFEELAAAAIGSPQALLNAMRPGLDTWQRTFSKMSVMPGDVFQVFRQPRGGEEQPQIPPALGYTRELQEEIKTGARLWGEFQKNLLEYQSGISKVAGKVVDRFRDRILGMANRGEKLSSLRELYNLWVECAEAAYGEHVFTKEYAECYGRMINSLVAFKNHSQFVVDEVLATMNMPTQQGFSTMQRQQQDLRREMRRSAEERRAQDETIGELRKELEALRAALSAVQRGAPGQKPAAASADSGGADGTRKSERRET
ncbi:MAG: poly(R)-hydroxyalkanoic acid synthase subunit PhaE, partial [Gammaproteobacteria bacterium]